MKIGLALSGGTLRGFAHIGVLEVLLDAGIEADVIAGTSVGSIVGAMYALGYSPKLMSQLVCSFPGPKLIDWSLPAWSLAKIVLLFPFYYLGVVKDLSRLLPMGLIAGDKLESYLRKLFKLTPVRKPVPLYVITTDLYTADTVIFTNDKNLKMRRTQSEQVYSQPQTVILPIEDLPAVVRASASIPGVFKPKQIGRHVLIDGGQRNNVPVDILYNIGCQKIIAVDLHRGSIHSNSIETFVDVFNRSLDIMMEDLSALRLSKYEFFPIIPKIEGVSWTSFDKIEYCLEVGRQTARNALPALRKYLQST
jgi:NTE family protein